MVVFSRALLLSFCLALTPSLALANPIMSAPQAQSAVASDEIILLDIRSRQEWKESGLAEGAWPVSMHERDFPQRLRAILAKYRPEQIALICATGGRSDYIADILDKNGVSGVIDVSEGMFGNDRGPGWLKRGLPVVTYEKAHQDYLTAMKLSK